MADVGDAPVVDPDELIPWIASRLKTTDPTLIIGPGEADSAVIRSESEFLVVTTDYLNSRPIVLELGLGDYFDVGRLLVSANISDLLAIGAQPLAILLAVMLPRKASFGDFDRLLEGVRDMASRCGVYVAGGDTKLATDLAICATAIGTATSRDQLTPSGAAGVGEDVWISGAIGSVAAAVRYLTNRGTDSNMAAWARSAIASPELPLERAEWLRAERCGRAGTDISDGFGNDVAKLARLSGCGVVIEAAAIPTAAETNRIASESGLPPWVFAFATGGDFQFAVTAPRSNRANMEEAGFVRVGEVVSGTANVLLLPDGRRVDFPDLGHRDARNLTFGEEIDHLLGATLNAIR